jgi:hypothetical protein
MALTPKDREKIVEEETLRYETRQALHRAACAQHRPNRWLWWLAVAALGYVVYCWAFCGGMSCLHHGGMMGKHCAYSQMQGAEGMEPGQALPPKK